MLGTCAVAPSRGSSPALLPHVLTSDVVVVAAALRTELKLAAHGTPIRSRFHVAARGK